MDTPRENAAIETNGTAQGSVSSTQNYFWWRQRHADINNAVNFHMARGNSVTFRSAKRLVPPA